MFKRSEYKYSFIIPLYNEEKNINILYKLINKNMQSINESYEIILVDDGSTDDTFKLSQ